MQPLRTLLAGAATAGLILAGGILAPPFSDASSHREAPLIADDPLADNTDVYAFRTPDDSETVTIVANYIPLSLPEGGPNFTHFGEDIRYEIHIKNQVSAGALGTATDDITYRFTFSRVNEDPSTFFNIRLGAENLNTSYKLEKSTDGGASFVTIVNDGATPPANIGPRSIEAGAGLGTTYDQLTSDAVETANTGETVFAGPRDDPFFVDLGGVFDLGGFRDDFGTDPSNPDNARDAVAGFNTHALVLQIPISMLQKDGMDVDEASSILDPNFVIGVWASASRRQVTTLSTDGSKPTGSGPFVQVSRLGMPLTNEAVIPIGMKDKWNYVSPYSAAEQNFAQYFVNPELGLYMGNGQFGDAVPGLSDHLTIQQNSYPALNLDGDGDPSNVGSGLDFTNGADGAAAVLPLVGNGLDIDGTAFAVPTRPTAPGVPTALLAPGQPRRVDILPIFYFGVPNLAPYQLATGKGGLVADTDGDGNLEFTEGKPFIHNFLPITQTPDGGLWGGDMLRLNMATPTTDRDSDEFTNWARLGLIRAAAIGLTVEDFATTDLEFIPHMDGFPNGRRLEDDVTSIELQAVGGLVLAAVGLPEDDATAGDYSDLASPQLVSELRFVAGPTRNDLPLLSDFPYLANPHRGYDYVKQLTAPAPRANFQPVSNGMGIGAPAGVILKQSFPNPTSGDARVEFQLSTAAPVRLDVFDLRGRLIQTLTEQEYRAGEHQVEWKTGSLAAGTYLYRLMVDGKVVSTQRASIVR
ncbi:DUF4331 family protein [Rubricoccus marinus]|uniref:DUF4331 family protein n=1 Tax=Rubricoccus marinus TaxID=716817 RepID=UPI000B98A71D|nr:DUF4331 family protein [Rubricoccus marinus]